MLLQVNRLLIIPMKLDPETFILDVPLCALPGPINKTKYFYLLFSNKTRSQRKDVKEFL